MHEAQTATKPIARLLTAAMLVAALVACSRADPTAHLLPTAAETTASTPTAALDPTPAPPTEIAEFEESLAVGDSRFVTRSIEVAIPAVAAADIDNDGDPDLVAAGEPYLTVYLNDGRGNLAPASQVPGGQQPDEFDLADLDGDGNLDLVIANHDTDHLTILLGDGRGGFAPAPDCAADRCGAPPPPGPRGQPGRDGLLDLVVDHHGAQGLLILRGLGDGRFENRRASSGRWRRPLPRLCARRPGQRRPARLGDPQPARCRSGPQPRDGSLAFHRGPRRRRGHRLASRWRT